jgi:hypothetical protein
MKYLVTAIGIAIMAWSMWLQFLVLSEPDRSNGSLTIGLTQAVVVMFVLGVSIVGLTAGARIIYIGLFEMKS